MPRKFKTDVEKSGVNEPPLMDNGSHFLDQDRVKRQKRHPHSLQRQQAHRTLPSAPQLPSLLSRHQSLQRVVEQCVRPC